MRPAGGHAVDANNDETRELAIGDPNLALADMRADVRRSFRHWQKRTELAMNFNEDLIGCDVLGKQRGNSRNVWPALILNDGPLPRSMLDRRKVLPH